MTILGQFSIEQFVDELSHEEELADMHFSTYFIPSYYQQPEEQPQ